jgi:hypothetical protein
MGSYSNVHHDKVSNVIVLRVNLQENTFTLVLMHKWVLYELELDYNQEIQAIFSEIAHQPLKGFDPRINPWPDKQQRNYKEAIKPMDSQTWAAAYNLEYI